MGMHIPPAPLGSPLSTCGRKVWTTGKWKAIRHPKFYKKKTGLRDYWAATHATLTEEERWHQRGSGVPRGQRIIPRPWHHGICQAEFCNCLGMMLSFFLPFRIGLSITIILPCPVIVFTNNLVSGFVYTQRRILPQNEAKDTLQIWFS